VVEQSKKKAEMTVALKTPEGRRRGKGKKGGREQQGKVHGESTISRLVDKKKR